MTGRLRRTAAIAGKEVRQLRRDRLTFGMIVGIPLLQILLFGYAIDTDVRELRAYVADQADTQLSRALIGAMEASQIIRVHGHVRDAAQLEEHLRRGDIHVGVFVPTDFERRLQDGRMLAQVLVAGTDPVVSAVASRLRQVPFDARGASPAFAPHRVETRVYYNPEGRSAVQIVPALIGVILTLTMVLFTAVALVRERERGNLELLITTPVRTPELMLGKLLPYVGIGLIQVTLILAVAWYWFGVPVRGTLLDVYLAALLFVAASLALGLLISTVAATQFQAMQLTVFTFLPSILLSGFMFPFEGMPRAAQWIGEILPLTHFVRLIRGIVLRGAGLGEMPAELLALAAFFAVVMALAMLRFRKRLD